MTKEEKTLRKIAEFLRDIVDGGNGDTSYWLTEVEKAEVKAQHELACELMVRFRLSDYEDEE